MSNASIEPFYRELGRRISELRTKRGLTQDDLANKIVPNVTRAAIGNIEGGKQRVLSHTLWQLAQALDVSPLDLSPLTPTSRLSSIANQRAVENDLQKSLNLPKSAIKKLAARMRTGTRGGTS